MRISKEKAIEEHRKMWNWIADETLKRKEYIFKVDYFNEHDIPEKDRPLHYCYCCEYTRGRFKGSFEKCSEHCPVVWGNKNPNNPYPACRDVGSEYRLWLDEKDICKLAELARAIANLPEKKLTKQEALENHRKMWNWIADKLSEARKVNLKTQYFEEHGILLPDRPHNHCYLCEYTYSEDRKTKDGKTACRKHCPVIWRNEGLYSEGVPCDQNGSEYELWYRVYGDYLTTLGNLEFIARQMVSLPERE